MPGIGPSLALVLLSEMDDLQRLPRGQDFVSYGRLVQGAQDSAGQRSGPSGKTIGHAHLQCAFSQAAGLFLRHHPAGQQDFARLERQPGQGTAFPGRAPKRARAVDYLLQRETAFDPNLCLAGERRGASEPDASRDSRGSAP